MTVSTDAPDPAGARRADQKGRLQALREQAWQRYASGEPGLHVAALISEMTDRLIVELFEETLQSLNEESRRVIAQQTAIIAIGGSGRGELAPYSDADILFLYRGVAKEPYADRVAQVVRDCWDARIKLGHSVRTVADALTMARREPQYATALVEARLLWGDERLYNTLKSRFYRKVVRNRIAAFYADCLAAREAERDHFGSTVRQLEPDIKRSPGGLRDIHLVRWAGFAHYGTADLDLLRMQGALTREDTHTLLEAHEFLMRIRVDLHFAAGKAQEVLSKAEQLRLAELYGYAATAAQRPVERFMQTYFRHSTAIADIASRFVARHRPQSLASRLLRFVVTHRSNGIFKVNREEIDVVARHRDFVCRSPEQLLNLYELASLYSVNLSANLLEAIKQAVPGFPPELSETAARLFLSILGRRNVGSLLRSMYNTGLLEYLIPEMAHARCLLQFNQYHSYTVDEHSLRAVEAAQNFEHDQGSVGAAYREIRLKHILHLALLLHDLGKGFEEDHSELGRRIAESVARRLGLSPHLSELLVFLVHKHLNMAHLAFRRDLSDPEVLLRFSRDVGSPENLRMLFVLTAADITAVGPGTWTEWKAELLTELYDNALLALGGEHQHFGEAERVRRVVSSVLACLPHAAAEGEPARPASTFAALRQPAHSALIHESPADPHAGESLSPHTVEDRLKTFPAHYLTATPAEQIVADLESIDRLSQAPVIVRSQYEAATNTMEYRVITRDQVGSGCFSKMTGALTAKRLEILSAQICTTSDGIVVDSYRVSDGDHAGSVPDFRIDEVEAAICDVLTGRRTVESLFQKHKRFRSRDDQEHFPLEPMRVVVDNESSERFTIIDVFAHDRPGLLYKIASTLLDLDLSVSLAKITTHLDQVLDVFYVTDREGAKLSGEDRLRQVQETLFQRIDGAPTEEAKAQVS